MCLADDGRSLFHRLLFRRDWPYFYASDLLEVDPPDAPSNEQSERETDIQPTRVRQPGPS